MKKGSIKNLILVSLFVILAPLILVGMTLFGNVLADKSKNTTQQTTQQAAKVPEENKTNTNDNNIPKANQDRVSDTNSNTSNQTTQSTNAVSTTPVAGQDYIVKNGDTLFSIASSAYGEANATAGVEKIKEENNIENNNVGVGDRIQIPRL